MKNTCASTLSAKGSDRSKTRERWIAVLPTSGARRQTTNVSAPKPASVTASRRRTSVRACKRHHREMTGARVKCHVGDDVVQAADVLGRQNVRRRPGCEH